MTKCVDLVLRPVIQKLEADGLFKEIEDEERYLKAVSEEFALLIRSKLKDRRLKVKVLDLILKGDGNGDKEAQARDHP